MYIYIYIIVLKLNTLFLSIYIISISRRRKNIHQVWGQNREYVAAKYLRQDGFSSPKERCRYPSIQQPNKYNFKMFEFPKREPRTRAQREKEIKHEKKKRMHLFITSIINSIYLLIKIGKMRKRKNNIIIIK